MMKIRSLIVVIVLLTKNFHFSDACGPNIRVHRLTGGIVVGAAAFYQFFSEEIRGKLWEGLELLATTSLDCLQRVAGWKGTFSPVRSLPETPQHSLVIRSTELHNITKMFMNRSSKCRVTFLYLSGLPGSGKSELSRQYGQHGFDQGEYTTVIALNAETEEQFRKDMVNAVLEIQSSINIKAEVRSNIFRETLPYLSNELRQLLKERPGWLLVVDNIREVELSLKLLKYVPKAGSETWGKGHVLLTTQIEDIVPPQPGHCVTLKKINEGMTSMDARRLLCDLVYVSHSNSQCLADAVSVVEQLEYLPLAILAAGVFIREETVTNKSYSFASYIQDFELNINSSTTYYEHFGASGVFPYKFALQTALRMAVNQSIYSRTDEYQRMMRDVYFFIGFVDQQEIPYYLLTHFLDIKGHDKGLVHSVKHSSLIDFIKLKNLFKIHQVTRDSFRFIVKKQFSNSGSFSDEIVWHKTYKGKLVEQLQDVSDLLFTEFETTDDAILYFSAKSFFACVYKDYGYVLPAITRSDTLEKSGSLFTILLLSGGLTAEENNICTYEKLNCRYIHSFLNKLITAQSKTNKPIRSLIFQASMFLGQVYRYILRDAEQARKFDNNCIELIVQTVPEFTAAEAATFFRVVFDRLNFVTISQSAVPVKNERKYHAGVIRFANHLLSRSHMDFWVSFSVGMWCMDGGMLQDAKQYFQSLLEKMRSSSITQVFPFIPVGVLFKLGHTNILLQDYPSAEDALTEGFSVDVDETQSHLSDGDYASARLDLSEAKIYLNKFDDAMENLQLAITLSGKDDFSDHFSLQVIVLVLRMIQKHKSDIYSTFLHADPARDLLSRFMGKMLSGRIYYTRSNSLTPEQLRKRLMEAVEISIDICDKKTTETLLQIATKLEEYHEVLSERFQNELKLLSEKTSTLRCSIFDKIVHYISGFLESVRSYGKI